MNLQELKQQAADGKLRDPDGEKLDLTFLPGLSESQIKGIEAKFGGALPTDLRELLRDCSGIEDGYYEIDFTGKLGEPGQFEDLLERGMVLSQDGCGNYWCTNLFETSRELAHIYFVCHDPASLDFEGAGIDLVFELAYRDRDLDLERLDQDLLISNDQNENLIPYETALTSDQSLAEFARSVGPEYRFVDLRNSEKLGVTLDLMEGPDKLRQCETPGLFAISFTPPRKGFFSKLFGL